MGVHNGRRRFAYSNRGRDAVYFPDWAGNLFAVKKDSGRLIWSHKISDYDGVDGAISRVSPAVDGNQVIIGDILSGKKVTTGERHVRRSGIRNTSMDDTRG